MGGKTVDRWFAPSAPVVFEAARHAAAELGYSIVHTDAAAQTVSFNTGRSMSSWAGQDLTASVFTEGTGSKVVVGGSLATRGNPMGGGSQIVSWGEKEKLSRRFLDSLGRHLSPNEGWLPDPSGRYPDRWWDGAQWTEWVRDKPGGTRSADPPGALPVPIPASKSPLAPAPAASDADDPDPIEQLRRLGELRDAGVVTPEQFDAKREELLRRI